MPTKRTTKKATETVVEPVETKVEVKDASHCAGCGVKLFRVLCKHNDKNFCGVVCYNAVVKD